MQSFAHKLIIKMLFRSAILLLLTLSSYACTSAQGSQLNDDRIIITVQRNYTPRPASEEAVILFDWSEVVTRLPAVKDRGILAFEQHFGKEIPISSIDTDGNGKPDKLSLRYTFTSTEPVYTFLLKPGKGIQAAVPNPSNSVLPDKRFEITYLKTYAAFTKGDSITNWPQRIIESTLHKYPDPAMLSIISPGEWNYESGFFLNAGFELWQQTRKQEYFNYIKNWVDRFITADGNIKPEDYDVKQYRLDDILPGRLCIFLYQQTGDKKYKKAADQLREHLKIQPRTSEGGYWHKQIYPHQMWLDGIYMGDVFSSQYAAAFNEPDLFNEVALQIKLIAKHTTDSVTGLMYHGWDEAKNPVWAHPVKGTSPEFWGRGMGWYMMALVECLDYLPKNHPDRNKIISIFKKLSQNIATHQDRRTSLWYQVLNKGDQAGNWIETSCSAMFAYAYAKGYHKGYLDKSFYTRSKNAFNSIIKNYCYFDNNGNLYLDQTVKVGTLNIKTSKGDYPYYIAGERRINDYKGLSPLLYTSMELSKSGEEADK